MSKKTLYEGKFKRLVEKDGWEYIERVNCCGIVAMLPVTDDGKVILVEQYRVPLARKTIEFPAGLADGANTNQSEESLEEAANRELIEETGYSAGKMIFVSNGAISGSSSSDVMTVFRATGLKKVGNGGGDQTENITVHEVPLKEIDAWLMQKSKEGFLVDHKVYAGLYVLKNS
ncbi:MAG: DNA mismatch repair protein MutT [Candidatus Omnitrophica bacterium CG11_big_fil_rev_8_21_14_0_20_45_26]|uniref:GDP-mannose pyrophosphatase n=1 Tax=Candidatus Abzuiibacterium crystallinum TaxID=1974748 RepID=A0A2H0LSE2_9BACT|nr:MAG: DNA mismatch repair protein MutT [Candidatus Omnitrophica bacterium CG11_big_fil_rev_8_21_14_0_20_45_26]PIW63978.1 MAG: hypothetical protein COW12_08740 [Candidatus Omnitrophica bacterium CG12_big_fil_rev_8_21_14_0_65_45_16]